MSNMQILLSIETFMNLKRFMRQVTPLQTPKTMENIENLVRELGEDATSKLPYAR